LKTLRGHKVFPASALNRKLKKLKSAPLKRVSSLEDILKRPEINYEVLKRIDHFPLAKDLQVIGQVEFNIKYAGFIQRQLSEIERFKKIDNIKIPADFDYGAVAGLSREIKEKLINFKPVNLGQAIRISGVTPAAVSIIMAYLKRLSLARKESNA
jgi:tRNA uridine 5-carboxymethylaminomethyl modification enzyme